MNNHSERIKENYISVLERIEQAARSVGRMPAAIKVVVVTKGQSLESVLEAYNAGIRVFGENYPEEGIAKKLAFDPDDKVEWHMIGHVQSRKAREVCDHYDWLHSLDSLKLGARLNRFAGEIRNKLPVLFEVNISGEQSKYGWSAWHEDDWKKLIDPITEIAALPNLKICGLMTIPPYLPDPEASRPYYQRLKRLHLFLESHIQSVEWNELSMGMSMDFEVAIQEGATMVRIGTAIMGPRNT